MLKSHLQLLVTQEKNKKQKDNGNRAKETHDCAFRIL